jgi:hypothetical protein
MLAFVADVTPYGVRGDERTNSQIDITPDDVRQKYQDLDDRERVLNEETQQIEQAGISKMSAEDQRKTEGTERQEVLRKKLREYLDADQWARYRQLQQSQREIRRERRTLPPRDSLMGLAKCDPNPPPMHVLLRGNPHVEGPEVAPRFPSLFGQAAPTIEATTESARSAGRRRVLADWIVSPSNRLTTRVMANRLWQFHFGRGLVRSPNNFGQLGVPPTHPELLDWLAQQLVAQGWRLKPMHRLIMLSQTYRMSSAGNPQSLATDPGNDNFWRFDVRRLSAEEIRDSVLAVNGSLNLTMFGKGFYADIPAEVLAGQSQPGSGWGRSSDQDRARRSVYIHVKRSLVTPFLSTFDFPETDASCEARFVTVQPSQAMAMINGKFLHDQARVLAERVQKDAGDDPKKQVRRTIELVLARSADEDEIQLGVKLLERLSEQHQLSPSDALRYYCLTAYNLNEFVYLD